MSNDTTVNLNTTENRKILYKYLVIQTMKEQNVKLEFAQKFAEHVIKKRDKELFTYHGLAWELGSKNLEFFCMFFLREIFNNEEEGTAEIAPIHKEIWSDIEEVILHNKHNKQGYILPRSTGKSAFGNLATIVWSHSYGYKKYSLVCSSIGSTAQKFVKQVKDALVDNIYIESCFGKLLDPSNKRFICNSNQLELLNRSMIESISSTSSMRGRKYGNIRVELAVLDDYQDEDDVATHEAREKKWKRFVDDVSYAMQKPQYKNGKIVRQGTLIALGTLQHSEDFYARLMKLPTWKFRHEKGVLIDDIDTLFTEGKWLEFKKILFNKHDENRLENAKEFYYQNEVEMIFPVLWSSYWSCLDMALDYYSDPVSFHQEVQGNINSKAQKRFTTIMTESKEKVGSHNFVKTMLCIDPAGTRNKGNKKDFYAFVVGSKSDMNIKYVRKGEVFKFEFEDYMKHTLELLKEYPDISHIYVEKNTYSGADVLRLQELIKKDKELNKRSFEWLNYAQTKNKDDRINTIVADVNMGRIVFNEEDEEAIEQLSEFAGCDFSKHDDFPDIVAEFSKLIDEIKVRNRRIVTFDRKILGI
ncbi:hypothetical protein [Bacillus weihaiensis]|uniref:hypothetical protein n=1 Tax=Bacillus weihaiensis TaxID=1547283 RepID=UPI0023575265|nr:hypothetical protein [Bacillus weihaiensis]